MPKVSVYNSSGEPVGDIELSAKVFEVKPSAALIQQLVVAEQANRRNTVAHTKTRGEVRGGGRKPWKQKGTGNARAGSIRSPLWKGGGVTFGPRNNRNYSHKVNRAQSRKGLRMVLSERLAGKQLFVLESMPLEKIQTKALRAILKQLQEKIGVAKTGVAVVIPHSERVLEYSARNLPDVTVLRVGELSAYKLLANDAAIILKDAVPVIEKMFLK